MRPFKMREPALGQLPGQVARKRALVELYSAEQMAHVLRRERSRCDRGGSQFSLVVLHLETNSSKRNVCRLAARVLKLVRETDEVGYIEPTVIGVVLPDTDPIGASIFISRIKQATAGKAWDPRCVVYAYPDVDDDQSGNGRSPNDSGMPIAIDQPVNGQSLPTSNGATHGATVQRTETYEDDPPISVVEIRSLAELLTEPLPVWKRAIDIIVSSAAIVMASPLMLAAALAIRIDSPGPVIFKQKRTGLGGRPFMIYKFRTMCIDAEARQKALRKLSEQDGPAFKLKRDPRITRIGALLRKTSVDELPQLFNILNGTMTLVGPRPLPVFEAEACKSWHQRRHTVTPGLTCIWQVHGRSRVKFEEWMRMDMRYAKRRTFWQDAKLVLSTVPAVLLRRGAN